MTELRSAKVIKKTITLEYQCDTENGKHSVKLTDFSTGSDSYFDDWEYDYVSFLCPICGQRHRFEI